MAGGGWRRFGIVATAVVIAAGSSCVAPASGGRARNASGAAGALGARSSAPVAGERTQALVMAMADDYIAALGEAVYALMRRDELSPTGRTMAQSFLRNGVGSALDIGSGPNPGVNLLDLLVMASLQTWSFERHWMALGIGEAGSASLERIKTAEAAMWASSRQMLSEEQVATLRRLIDAWIAQNPERTVVALVRFDEFADERMMSSLALRGQATGLLREVTVAAGAIDEARLLGERVLWYASRYPYLLGEQTELTAYRLVDQPEAVKVVEALDSVGQLSRTLNGRVETMWADIEAQRRGLFEQVAAEREQTVDHAKQAIKEILDEWLEDAAQRIRAERSAGIDDFFARFAAERAMLLDDIESRQGEMRAVMNELRTTVEATGGLAKELTQTVGAIDRVVARFDHDPNDPRKPLELADVREALAETGRAAERMTRVLELTNELVENEGIDQRIAGVREPLNAVIDRAFWRGVMLILLLLGGLGVLKLLPRAK